MKTRLLLAILILSTTFFVGCNTFPFKHGPSSVNEEKNRAKIENVDSKLSKNIDNKMDLIATLAYGTDRVLNKVNEPPKEVIVAKDMNQRVMSLAGTPSLEKMKEMQKTIDNLVSTIASERNDGKTQLNKKDEEINYLQSKTKTLLQERDTEIHKYMNEAKVTAALADEYKTKLDKMDSYLGLGAVWYGMKKFVISCAWILGIGGILFFALRIFSMSNPIAGAVFGVFNVIGGYIIKAVNVIIPRAIEFSGHIATEVYSSTKLLLNKIVDSVQWIRQLEKVTGKDITLKELLVELDKKLDGSEKDIIDKMKKDLGY